MTLAPEPQAHPASPPPFISDSRFRPVKSHAEHRVDEALQTGLPSGWLAWHSLRIHDDSGAEGEGDYILIDPDRGMLIIEVKGGAMETRDGRWFQNGKPLDHSPCAGHDGRGPGIRGR